MHFVLVIDKTIKMKLNQETEAIIWLESTALQWLLSCFISHLLAYPFYINEY